MIHSWIQQRLMFSMRGSRFPLFCVQSKFMTLNPHITIVTPVFGCDQVLVELYERLCSSLSTITERFEIIMVNDASPDCAWDLIQKLAQNDPRVKGINLSRNFGQHHAITAGLDFAQGDWVVVMDCDLQDQPEEIPKLYFKALEGYDLVVGLRIQRQDNLLRKLISKLFSTVFTYFADIEVDNQTSSFGIYSRKVIRSITHMKEQHRSFGLFALWVGFRRVQIPIRHSRRQYGKSSYNFSRMFKLAMNSIISHSNKLLSIFVTLGFTISSISLVYACWRLIKYFFGGEQLLGWTSLIVSIYLTAGLIIAVIGVVGIYIGKIFDEVKGRPLYIIESTTFQIGSKHE